jgi:hypothetical protein
MIFSFNDDIFNDLNDDTLHLLDKIWINSLGRHDLFIGDNRLLDAIINSDWYKEGIRKSSKEYIDSCFRASINIKRRNVNIIVSNEEECYTLVEADEILNKTFHLILENIEYDKYFFQAIVNCFINESKKVKLHLEKGWLIVVNGGGNNISNVLNEKKVRYNKPEFPKHASIYLRSFVIIDSDKKYPSENEVSNEKQNLLNNIKEVLVTSYHVLKKREIENYLPDETFKSIRHNDDFVNAYLSLNDLQKDYLDVENGLPDKNIDQLTPDELKDLYSDLVNPHLNTLRKSKLILKDDELKVLHFKQNYPKMFLHKTVNKNSLKERANSDELEEILHKLTILL